MRIAVDLDDTLCDRTKKEGGTEKYDTCFPIEKNIEIVNNLHDNGVEIVIYTARGMSHFKGDVSACYKNLYELTESQLKEWGVKYDKLVMGKIHYDLLIDDKAINPTINNWTDLLKGFYEK